MGSCTVLNSGRVITSGIGQVSIHFESVVEAFSKLLFANLRGKASLPSCISTPSKTSLPAQPSIINHVVLDHCKRA